MSDSGTSKDAKVTALKRPDVRAAPRLDTSGYKTGVTDHAAKRYKQRARCGTKQAVRRAYAAGGELEMSNLSPSIDGDSARYDPLTGTVLIEENGSIRTVIDADDPMLWACLADELERRGYGDD